MRRYFHRTFTGTMADHGGEYGSTVYDEIWYDRKTGECVLRYDGADPANKADPDDWTLYRKGHDVEEEITDDECVVKKGQELAHHKQWCERKYGDSYGCGGY